MAQEWKKSRVRAILTALFAAILCGGVFMGTAFAYNTASYWNTSGTPLETSSYGSTAKAYGYIKIYNGSNGTRLYSYAWNKFTDADNHRAYIQGVSQFNAGTCRALTATVTYKGVSVASSASCSQQFYDYSEFRSDGLNYTRNVWTQMPNKNTGVHSGADRGRARVKLCIDIPWRTDSCTGQSYSASDSW
jgi:hypothetical protein